MSVKIPVLHLMPGGRKRGHHSMSHARNERNGVVTLAVTRLIHRQWSQPKAFSVPACETHHYPFGKEPCLKCPKLPTSQNHLSASISQLSQFTNRTKTSAQSHVANVPTYLSHTNKNNDPHKERQSHDQCLKCPRLSEHLTSH